jgi:DNA-binding FadR family transcriptional regulator
MTLRAAAAIRDDALNSEDGELLGVQDELARRYGVSRPTLMQAIALVTQENLLVSKSGPNGGYFVRRPDSRAVARAAAVYLHSRKVAVEEIVRAMGPLRVELAKLAADNDDPKLRARLENFVEREERLAAQTDAEFIKAEHEFTDIICELSGNRVISLLFHILTDCIDMTTPNADIFSAHQDRVVDYRIKRKFLAQSVLMQDADLAALAAERCATSEIEWILSDLELHQGQTPEGGAAGGREATLSYVSGR